MAIQTRNKEIMGKTIMVTQFPGTLSLTYKVRILNMLGGGIGGIISQIDPKAADSVGKDKLDILAAAIGQIFEKINPDDFTKFVLDLLQCTRINGQEITKEVFDLEFAGDLLLMYKILLFTLEVNYGNFFGKDGFGSILKKKPKADPSMKK
jgi:hypothetical protein